MATRDASRAITSAQLVGILAFTLALFFVVAFATKTADAYRLRNWRDQLRQEIADMERQRAALQAEIERRQSMAWVDQVLRSSGYLPEGVVRVIVEPEEGQLESTVQTPAPLPTSQAVEGAPALGNR
ncbi:MAG: hypothetical protein H5T69_15930, partial [Chloroflexi bacterium]|nr:hypothetical protein [Chloroflexota bacterium]